MKIERAWPWAALCAIWVTVVAVVVWGEQIRREAPNTVPLRRVSVDPPGALPELHTLSVQARIARDGQSPVPMELEVETSSPISVLTADGLKKLGLDPAALPEGAQKSTHYPIRVDAVWIGRLPVERVTFLYCPTCGPGDGGLGLDVLERIDAQIRLDADAPRLIHAPKARAAAGGEMVKLWLSVNVHRKPLQDAPGIRVAVRNNGPLPAHDVVVRVDCLPGEPLVLSEVLPGERRIVHLPMPDGERCASLSGAILSAGL